MAKRKASEISDASAPHGRISGHGLIEGANFLPTASFVREYVDKDRLRFASGLADGQQIEIGFGICASVSDADLKACFELVETTSRDDYESSSIGWHAKRKRREMMEEGMRYMLVRRHADAAVEGFLSFMLTHDSTPSVPVMYIYEIHLNDRLRGVGLGKHLMETAEQIAAKVGVSKVMLTCFLSNTKALDFYKKRGYEVDVSSPQDRETRNKVVKTDYVILSQEVELVTDATVKSERGDEVCSAPLTIAQAKYYADGSQGVSLMDSGGDDEDPSSPYESRDDRTLFADGTGSCVAGQNALRWGDLETAASDRDDLGDVVTVLALRWAEPAKFDLPLSDEDLELEMKYRKLNRDVKNAKSHGVWVIKASD